MNGTKKIIKKFESNPKIIDQIIKYYYCLTSKYNMILTTKNREVAFLRPKQYYQGHNVRNIKAFSAQKVNDWMWTLMKFDKMKKGQGFSYNMYVSNAEYKHIPPRDIHTFKQDVNWWKTHYKHISRYDFFIDIDSPVNIGEPFNKSRQVCFDIHQGLNKANVPHQVIYSGMGFHIIIPQENVTKSKVYDPDDKKNIYAIYSRYAGHLQDIYGDMIDTKVYDDRRLRKLPYSLAIYKSFAAVVLPLQTSEQIEFFNASMSDPYLWIDNNKPPYPKHRGIHTFNEGGKGRFIGALKRMKNEKRKKDALLTS